MTTLFRDDFAGSALDTTKWRTGWFGIGITHPVNGAERAAYDPACVKVHNDRLHLLLKKKPVIVGATTYPERAGCITTYDTFKTPTTNYSLEAKIYLPGDPTHIDDWPAFWTDGFGNWPATGEDDVLEGLSGKAAWHYHSPSGAPGGSVTMGQGWHTFRVECRGGTAAYYYDGHQVGSLAIVEAEQFIILGHQSGTYGGFDAAGPGDDMKVEYVEVASL